MSSQGGSVVQRRVQAGMTPASGSVVFSAAFSDPGFFPAGRPPGGGSFGTPGSERDPTPLVDGLKTLLVQYGLQNEAARADSLAEYAKLFVQLGNELDGACRYDAEEARWRAYRLSYALPAEFLLLIPNEQNGFWAWVRYLSKRAHCTLDDFQQQFEDARKRWTGAPLYSELYRIHSALCGWIVCARGVLKNGDEARFQSIFGAVQALYATAPVDRSNPPLRDPFAEREKGKEV